MTEALNWNLPLVAVVGAPLKVHEPDGDGDRYIKHKNGDVRCHRPNGETISDFKRGNYTLRNRQWRVGDRVVTLGGGNCGVVIELKHALDTGYPVIVEYDNGDFDGFTDDGRCLKRNPDDHITNIRYDYSRARTVAAEPDVEALIADEVLPVHGAGRSG